MRCKPTIQRRIIYNATLANMTTTAAAMIASITASDAVLFMLCVGLKRVCAAIYLMTIFESMIL